MYKKGDSIFWVRTVLTNGSDEWYIDETIKEVPDPTNDTGEEDVDDSEEEDEDRDVITVKAGAVSKDDGK